MVLTPAADTLAEGDTLRLSAEARDANGNAVADAGFGWSSSDTAVVLVDSAGLVTAAAPGTAMVTAASGDAQGTAELTVFEADRIALGAFYRATGGPNWKNSDNWLTDAPLGDWYGVQTDSAGRVVTLELVGELTGQGWISHGLRGSIPPEIGRLSRLRVLFLFGNDLSGPIPSEFGNLSHLESVSLAANALQGPIPAELGNLTNLFNISLSDNALEGSIPSELGNLPRVNVLTLDRNRLTGPIPPELGNLAELSALCFHTTPWGPLPGTWWPHRSDQPLAVLEFARGSDSIGTR